MNEIRRKFSTKRKNIKKRPNIISTLMFDDGFFGWFV
jgi:hypothetical protein